MADVLDGAVLVRKPIIQFFLDVSSVLLELTQRVLFDLLDFLPLAGELSVKLADEFALGF